MLANTSKCPFIFNYPAILNETFLLCFSSSALGIWASTCVSMQQSFKHLACPGILISFVKQTSLLCKKSLKSVLSNVVPNSKLLSSGEGCCNADIKIQVTYIRDYSNRWFNGVLASLFTSCMWIASEQAHFKHQKNNFHLKYSERETVLKCILYFVFRSRQ